MCKDGDVFSLAVLIDRGLDLVFRVRPILPWMSHPTLVISPLLLSLFSSQGSFPELAD